MKQIQRFGIEIDVCPTSGGIWLDKGELEKLLLFIKQAAEEEAEFSPSKQYSAELNRRGSEFHDDHHMSRKFEYKKKKSGLSQIMDIFDF